MYAAKFGLPTSLTPEVLGAILRFEPRHRKEIRKWLERRRSDVWKEMSTSEKDFYDDLHERLTDPDNRREFDAAVKAQTSPKRLLGFFQGIVDHYVEGLSKRDDFLRVFQNRHRELVDAISHHGDDERLANVVWAMLEEEKLSDDDVSEIAEKHPGVRDRLGCIVDGGRLEGRAIVDRWQTGLSRLRETLNSAESKEPDSNVVDRIAKCVDELRTIVSEVEDQRLSDFSSSLAEIMRKHRNVLSDQSSLKPYIHRAEQHPIIDRVPEDANEFLNKFNSMLISFAKVVDKISRKSQALAKAALASADAQELSQLVKEISELRAIGQRIASDIRNLLSKVFDRVDLGSDKETPQTPSDTSSPSVSEGSGSGKLFDVEAEEFTTPAHDELGEEESIVSSAEDVPNEPPDGSEGDDQEDEEAPPKTSAEASTADDTLQDATLAVGESSVPAESISGAPGSQSVTASNGMISVVVSEEKENKVDSSPGSTPPPADQPPSTGPSPGDEGHSPRASKSLDGMFRSRRYARAYWLARADYTFGDPDLFGALCEGARIGPGDPCPGALVHFFNGLADKDQWQDDERLLLSASVLGPCLFVDPLPQDIYLLANRFPKESSPVGNLMQRVRELCVLRGARIRPEDLGVESADATRAARLDQLRSDAEQFLERVPHIRFLYAPTDFALQFLYRAGSEWHRLHVIVGGDHVNRLNEARTLVKALDPGKTVEALHDHDELPALKQPLEGRAREKLARHLHDTLALARQWIRLAAESENRGQSGSGSQSDELLRQLKKLLPSARKALASAKGRGAVDALDNVLEDLEARIQDRVSEAVGSISDDLLLLSGVELEDDLEPVESDLDALRGAILEAEQSQPEAEVILSECLDRGEYLRARKIIENCQLGESSISEYKEAVGTKRSALEIQLRELELEIEDAFLLGQLRDDADEDRSVDDQTSNALERSELLGVVRDSGSKLGQFEDSEGSELRSISRKVDEVRVKVEEMTSKRRERLRREFHIVMGRFPGTAQGDADRNYLRKAFEECMEGNDHVAAFDLLDRGRQAAQAGETVARTSTGSSQELELFLKRAEGYRNALSKRDWFLQIEENVQKCSTFSGIPFGQFDRTWRDETIRVLGAWHSITQLRFTKDRRQLMEAMEQLLHFIGLPLLERGIQVADTTQPGFAHIRGSLARPVTSSPLPAFGSACGNRFEIIVCQTHKEPEQLEEYIRGRGLAGTPVLAILLHPQTLVYRIKWHGHFARARLAVLPFDPVFLLHLCGERNRLPVLFKLGLPFTWARPYITKGENVPSEMFVGRRSETAALMDPDGSCIVFGGRQLGKSALLRHVRRENHDPENSIYVIYLDVDDLGTDSQGHDAMMPAFWRRVYDELVLCHAIPELPPKVLAKDSRLVQEATNSISTRLSENPHMRIVLLLDEADDLLDCDSGRDFILVTRLRGLMANSERRFKVVFAGLQSVQRYYNWKNHPFAQLGTELVVNPLPPDAAQELIIRPLRALGFAFQNTRLVLRILSQTNYHPGLIQIIGYRLLENLFEKWQRQDAGSPVRPITHDDLLRVERDASIMEDIRNRFDWTLDLDDRYKVLTYALVLTPDPTAPRRESEFMAIGAYWWKAVFEDMDAQGLRAVLDEMVGLGVLLREHEESVRTYRLRSPNLLRLLGPQETIETELLRIIDRDRVSRPNPRNFHPIVDRKTVAFGPLTNEQVGLISGQRRPFQLTVVTGSEALGLAAVERQLDKLLGEASGDGQDRGWKKIEHPVPADAEGLIKTLRDSLKSRRRTHRYAVVRLGEVEYEGDLSALFGRLIRELGQVCTNESKAHLVLLVDPRDSWRWLRDRNRERVLSQSRVTGLELRRWSDGAIANAFDSLGARTGSQLAGEEVFHLTSGFHWLVAQGLSRARPRSGVNASTLVPEWRTLCSEMLTGVGIEGGLLALGVRGTDPRLESYVLEVLRLGEETDKGRLVLTETGFDLAAEALQKEDREWYEIHAVHIREWMRSMDLARPLNTNEEGSMVMATWVRDVIMVAGG